MYRQAQCLNRKFFEEVVLYPQGELPHKTPMKKKEKSETNSLTIPSEGQKRELKVLKTLIEYGIWSNTKFRDNFLKFYQ